MLLDHLTDIAFHPPHTAMPPHSNVFASSPVLALPLSHPDSYFNSAHYAGINGVNQTRNPINSVPVTPNGSAIPTPGALAGRKRSRGDIHAPEDDHEQHEGGSVTSPIEHASVNPRGKPLYGEGVTATYPEPPSYAAAAEPQSGTWTEENVERKPFHLSHAKRPSVNSRKSQRKDTTVTSQDDLAQLVLPPLTREATREPLIDEATRLLGISWTRMDASEATRINQAAYSKFIQNHYPGLKDVAVWFENSALPGYLVEAWNGYNGRKEYYIFSQDLTEGKLVTTEPSQLVPRLQMLPALHLAAPGGHIRAQTNAAPARQAEANDSVQAEVINSGAGASILSDCTRDGVQSSGADVERPATNGACSAHEMELD